MRVRVSRLMELLMMSNVLLGAVVLNGLMMLCFQYDLKWCFHPGKREKER